ncbi:cupin domain-containing protein [Amycolatopsis acidicola]|uniref:Cupin domain-containing protein n=1 Tax=Amycolatopsis acidicola TaxID=2596893 RepID=A0A5N0V4I4_9PSEU|nr:cupin domain-containing protein [Amycolatopsis acidicola]KAA9160704.1 cupin domain-containing protein [Amycolatopsis acidicola]
MGLTKVIDRTNTDKTDSYWPGFHSEIICSAGECESQELFYVDATADPGATTELHAHDTEIAFFVSRGTVLAVLVSEDGQESEGHLCPRGTSGYISPGEGFLLSNIGDEEAELLMAHYGANSKETAKGRVMDVPEQARKILAEHGVK